ncbi:undecaprenyldiphospho-muramoylpentapeptide beta-N-acetylglucosaminyltransferase [Corynebacterium halotolerans]|uniref:UDP-N-acetylglucosamine--N-acetylmuramyl-(pentapeptide) pyrophosphoryl-undecaprenol N-acetylglucosamine transferase n=1 Tax=Corynebacterium halotolerans YIM 70093 = DSM 44683 TaxID=1121362 RepID=M1MYV6_9CORY|nr:undecaprenyldiphospho-muramoylpentapeptide beta-N-acetylglucosaminyltransferase [Corynebacterium halotolerans]AGF72894.1 undecaprenyldiphospho-muramoylpentapeptide beta-N- acetylglucosaminyltransferase [Corynebacterium halotolerans YIM 70093 = DSM 44683]
MDATGPGNNPDSGPSIVIAGGGTAGHIEPALAVGEALRRRHNATVTALGTSRGLESDLVPGRGFDLRMIDPVPVPRKVSADLFKLPFRVVKAVLQARRVLKDVGAQVLFGTGGYVAAPAYIAARTLNIPFFVLETNALAGMANKLGVRLGGTGLNAVAGSGMPGEVVGIPVRPGLGEDRDGNAVAYAREEFGLADDRRTLLVTGGSQGAASINRAVEEAVPQLIEAGYQILHAYGAKNDPPATVDDFYVTMPYIHDMSGALTVADMIVCRSGAMTVAEVTAAGVPAVYVPLPHGNGEQGRNARQVVEEGAARLVDDSALTPQLLVEQVNEILGDEEQLRKMRSAATRSSTGDVSEQLADRVVAAMF